MRFFAVLGLFLFSVLPAMAAGRLPVVNVSSGGVSARAAFGDTPNTNINKQSSVAGMYGTFADSAPSVPVAPVARTVSARAVTPVTTTPTVNKDYGEKITRADILSPKRPSSDLWAQTDTPLRMPTPQEFSVIRSDATLPDESLDTAPRVATTANKPEYDPMNATLDDFNAQVARLTKLQHQADASFYAGAQPQSQSATQPVSQPQQLQARAQHNAQPQNDIASRRVIGRVPSGASVSDEPVKLSRLVVPMDDDVVVRSVKKAESKRIAAVRDDMQNLSPAELRQAFRKTFLSENKYLSTYPVDDRFDVASDMSSGIEGFTARRDLSESEGNIRPLEIKIKFRNEDSALSRDNYQLLKDFAIVVLNNPTRAIQVGIPQGVTRSSDAKKLAARRLAIVEQVLRDSGVSEYRIMPVLVSRNDESFVLRVISGEQYETMYQQRKNLFGDTVDKKSYKSMTW